MILELRNIIETLQQQAAVFDDPEFNRPLDKLLSAAEDIAKSWSGSWLGYHACVYYKGLLQPPTGARFSKDSGLTNSPISDTVGQWQEFKFDAIVSEIENRAGNPDIQPQKQKSYEAKDIFEDCQSQVQSLLSGILSDRENDKFLTDLSEKLDTLKTFNKNDCVKFLKPSGHMLTRDMVALQAGLSIPPHIDVLTDVYETKSPFQSCGSLAKTTVRLLSHIENLEKRAIRSQRIGTNVFIGHGQSKEWKDLKDFIQDRIRLPWDEFNRVPIAGFTNIARLSQMLEEAAIAFLIMTAEDEQADGTQSARQNVIHEAGLFQGRLGFARAIILLEDGCEEFSNIEGLGQIRFPKGNISAVFEEIRRVLEREGLIEELN